MLYDTYMLIFNHQSMRIIFSSKHFLKAIVKTIVSISIIASTHADDFKLNDSDRKAILEQLEKIEQTSNDRVTGLYLRAIRDYRSAMLSETAVMDLYLNCYEKVNFEDKNLKASAFREWKKKNKDRLGEASFRTALKHQLAWLLLSIETASKEPELTEMGERAVKHLNTIFAHADQIKGNHRVLKQNVLGSVFARAYELNIKIEKWPKSGLDIANIYETLVLPPLRNTDSINDLRAAWQRRIVHEGLVIDKWTEVKDNAIGMKGAIETPEMQTFIEERRPQLLWAMEKDCFQSGDERNAAMNMLKHLELYVRHKDAPGWIEEFQGYISPETEELSE